jgi:hypothetical protein
VLKVKNGRKIRVYISSVPRSLSVLDRSGRYEYFGRRLRPDLRG